MAAEQTIVYDKKFKCTAAFATAFLIVKFGADDDTVSQATAVTEVYEGIAQHSTVSANDEIAVMVEGISRVVAGGTITRGDYLTSDANGKAVTAAPAAGINNNIIGIAQKSGVVNDIITVRIAPQRIQG